MKTPHFYISRLCAEHPECHPGRSLMVAIAANDVTMLQDAIDNGSNPNAGEGLALIAAIITGQFPLVQALANKGASFTLARKIANTQNSKWIDIYRRTSGLEETEAHTAYNIWGDIVGRVDTYQTAYTETQERLEALQKNQKLDEIVQAINALRETIADITTPKTIQKPLTIPLPPTPKV